MKLKIIFQKNVSLNMMIRKDQQINHRFWNVHQKFILGMLIRSLEPIQISLFKNKILIILKSIDFCKKNLLIIC